MPFSGRWFYGDTLFIADIWMWLLLGLGVYLAAGAARPGPPGARSAAVSVYVLVMVVSASVCAGKSSATSGPGRDGSEPTALMVGPLPVTPLSKAVIVDAGDHFETGTFSWLGADASSPMSAPLPNRMDDPAVVRARQSQRIEALLGWSRFPYFDSDAGSGGHRW